MTIELRAGELHLVLDPATGGAIAALTHRGTALLRPVADPRLAAQHGREVAGYPLIPYANRIACGRFTVDGRSYQLDRNFADGPHTIHGNAWMNPWTVADARPRSARLVFDHVPPGDPAGQWPFAYHAEQIFELSPEGLRITLSVQNRDARSWPAGLGLHPYVVRTGRTTVRFAARRWWRTGADGLPETSLAVAGRESFAQARLPGIQEIDACYEGWDGSAEIDMPEGGLKMALHATPPLDHLQVYTPAGQDFMGLEPVSNMPDAINRTGGGLRTLACGETLKAAVILAILPSGDRATA